MAKQRRQHTGTSAIQSLLGAINQVAKAEKAKVDGSLTTEQQVDAVNTAMDAVEQATGVIGESNLITALELQDDAIEQYHQIAEQAELAEAQEQQRIANETIARLTGGQAEQE